nr:uncharacterized protein LOC111417044 [Onthophagus taurus]
MLQAIYGIDKKIKNIQESISFDIELKLFNNHQVNRFTTKFDNFINGTKQIDYLYTQFMKFYKDSTLYNLKSRQIFIDACFNLEDGLNFTLYFMSKMLVEDGGAFNLITGNTVEQHILATRRLSTLEYLYNLVAYFITIEIKAALTITGAKRIAILTDSDKDYEEDYNNYMKFVPLRIISVIISLLTYAPKCSGRYWVYDTHKYRIGHKYVAFNNFLKGFYYRDTSCSYAGQPINSTGSNIDRSECEVENFNSCNGTLHCLPNSETSSSVDICYNAEGKNSNYEYVVLNKTGTKDCSSTKISYKPNTKCIDCFCYCEESEVNAHIYFSLDEMVSDIENNR